MCAGPGGTGPGWTQSFFFVLPLLLDILCGILFRGLCVVGRATEAVTEQIRQASDIVDVVSSYVSIRRAGKDFKALCPFHREKTPSFHAVPAKQIFKCFGCGAGGDVFKFIQLRENVDFLEARRILAERAGIRLDESGTADNHQVGPGKVDIERANKWAVRWFKEQLSTPAGRHAAEYATSRGISPESLDRFAVGYAPDSWDALQTAASRSGVPSGLLLAAGLVKPREDGSTYDAFRERLIFPIQDAMGRTLGIGGRTLRDDPAKYLNSPQSILFDKSRCLYGLATAKDAFSESRMAVIVEGYTDCLLAQQHGFVNTVATLGTALTLEHVRMLRRYVDEVIVLFDSDEAGQRAADQCLQHFLAEQLDVRLAHVTEGKDPADLLNALGPDAFRRTLTSAVGALELKWRQVSRRYRDGATGPGRRRAIEDFLALLASSGSLVASDPIQRGMVLNRVGRLLGLSSEEVNRQLRIVARRTVSASEEVTSLPRQGIPRSPDAGAAAMRDILGVLLNEPDNYNSVAEDFAPELLQDSRLREIAEEVADWSPRATPASLPTLISRFESPETAALIMELQAEGEARGNFGATLEGAVARLQEVVEHGRLSAHEAQLRQIPEKKSGIGVQETVTEHVLPKADSEEDAEVTSAFYDSARKAGNVNRFAARRHMGGPATVDSRPSGTRSAD